MLENRLVHLVSFATPQYRNSQKKLEKSALENGINILHSFNEKDLVKTAFYNTNKNILKKEKGFGYWLWKPYFILDVLKKANKGDILMYLDAGNKVIADLTPLFDLCLEQKIVLFQVHTHKNKIWTKRDTFVFMDCDQNYYWESEQVCGSPQLYLVCPESIIFVEKWLNFCKHPNILTDIENSCGLDNLPEFKEHRHDQSILSLLALKESIKIHRDPSQYGNPFMSEYLYSSYKQLLDLHRTKKIAFKDRLLSKIKRMKNK